MRRRFNRREWLGLGDDDALLAPDRPPGPWRRPLAAPGTYPAAGDYRAPFVVQLNPSGARGTPLTVERALRVIPPSTPHDPLAAAAQPPSTDLARWWPWIFPPDDAYPIVRVSASVTVPASGTSILVTITELPRTYMGVVKKFGQASNDFTNIAWSFLIKGRPADPITGQAFQYGSLSLPTDLPGPGTLLRPGDDFQVQAVNLSGVAITGVRAVIHAYLWPIRATV